MKKLKRRAKIVKMKRVTRKNPKRRTTLTSMKTAEARAYARIANFGKKKRALRKPSSRVRASHYCAVQIKRGKQWIEQGCFSNFAAAKDYAHAIHRMHPQVPIRIIR